MKAAFLDWNSLNGEELDKRCLDHLPVAWQYFGNISRSKLVDTIAEMDIMVTNKVVIDAGLIEKAKHLKLICVAATGTNNVDVATAAKNNIAVCNVRGYAADSVVQHVFMLMLNLTRRYNQYQQAIQRGEWQRSEHFCFLTYPIESLTGKTLGIIGYGELGRAVAKMAKHFGMHILIAESILGKDSSDRISLEKLLQQSDVISLHCPLTEQTRDLIGERELLLMKNTAFLINTARGGIVNEAALLNAVKTDQIAGAATDVLTVEPPLNGHLLLEANLPNLIVTPHIAWGTKQARQTLLDKVADNIDAWLNGSVINQVN